MREDQFLRQRLQKEIPIEISPVLRDLISSKKRYLPTAPFSCHRMQDKLSLAGSLCESSISDKR